MSALAEMFRALGHRSVSTYIQSGNVRFEPATAAVNLEAEVEAAITHTFGHSVSVIVRSVEEIREIGGLSPFAASPPEQHMVVFLREAPAAEKIAGLDPARSPPDQFAVRGREIYAACPNGFARTKLTLDWFEKRLGTVGTARNWKTVGVLGG